MLDIEYIRSKLVTSYFDKVYYYDKLNSTNNYAIENQLSENTVIIAGVQSSGKGRSARVWESDSSDNLYFSIVLPLIDISKLLPLNIIAGYSVCDTVRKYTNSYLKWPNDLIIDGKKAGGLLIEVKFSGNKMTKAVLGIGINVNTKSFPDSIKDIATSISATFADISREDIFIEFILNFEKRLDELVTDSIDIVSLWKNYSANYNNHISVHIGDEKKMFIERGINTNGGLIVEDNSGKLSEIYSGDIGYDFCS